MTTIDTYIKSLLILHYGPLSKKYSPEILDSIDHQITDKKKRNLTIGNKTVFGVDVMLSAHEGQFVDKGNYGVRTSEALFCILSVEGFCELALSTIESTCTKLDNKYDLENETITHQTFEPITIDKYATMKNKFEIVFL